MIYIVLLYLLLIEVILFHWMSQSFVVQSLSHIWLFVTPRTAPHQASLSFIISQSWLKLISIESVMLSNHLILCRPLLLLPSVFPSFRVFSSESALGIRWSKYWSFSSSPFNEVQMSMWSLETLLAIGITHLVWIIHIHFEQGS